MYHLCNTKMQSLQVNTPSLWIEPKTRIEEIVSLSKRGNTRKSYKNSYNELLKFLNGKPITQVTVQEFYIHLLDEGKKYNTILSYATGIKYHTGIEPVNGLLQGLKNHLPFERVVTRKPSPLTAKQIAEVSGITEEEKLLLSVGFFFCLRVSELVRLRKEDFQRKANSYVLSVNQSKNYSKGVINQKVISHSTRDETKDISPMVLLDNYLPTIEGYLFKGRNPFTHRTERGVNNLIKKLFGESYSSHSLRSGSITEAIGAGATTSQLMHLSAHKNASSLKEYDLTEFTSSAVSLIL